MVLDREERQPAVHHPFAGVVVEVHMREDKILGIAVQEIRDTFRKEDTSTAKLWFCAVISTLPVVRS